MSAILNSHPLVINDCYLFHHQTIYPEWSWITSRPHVPLFVYIFTTLSVEMPSPNIRWKPDTTEKIYWENGCCCSNSDHRFAGWGGRNNIFSVLWTTPLQNVYNWMKKYEEIKMAPTKYTQVQCQYDPLRCESLKVQLLGKRDSVDNLLLVFEIWRSVYYTFKKTLQFLVQSVI